ncbi:MAG: Cna B-type domain-containing protein [Ruminococcaceae bacterium]|nr:Cna B-type domain-containing protein [Oscillospiraceae bacterium]
MKKNWTKYLSVLLSVLMLVAMLTVGVSALDPTGQQSSQTGQGTIDWNGPSNYPSRPNAPMNPAPDDDYEEEEDDKIDIVVRKKWVGDNESIRPSEVLVQLIENGDPVGKPVAIKASKVSDKNWKYTWEGMDEGSEYTIVEINTPEGYTSVVEHLRGNYWTITNTYNPAPSYSSEPAVKGNPETGAGSFSGAGLALLLCCAVGVACTSRK